MATGVLGRLTHPVHPLILKNSYCYERFRTVAPDPQSTTNHVWFTLVKRRDIYGLPLFSQIADRPNGIRSRSQKSFRV